jgi:hypothetical protein
MMCDPADYFIGYGIIAEGLVIFALGMKAYRDGGKALDEASCTLKKIDKLHDETRDIRDQWKFAKMLSDAEE